MKRKTHPWPVGRGWVLILLLRNDSLFSLLPRLSPFPNLPELFTSAFHPRRALIHVHETSVQRFQHLPLLEL